MHFTTFVSTAAVLAGFTSAAPHARRSFGVPTEDGFPNINENDIKKVNDLAGGMISNSGAPTINASSAPVFQLVTFNENFEVAYFASLLKNLSAGAYDNDAVMNGSQDKKKELQSILETVLAQEKLHSINAANVLKKNNLFVPAPCTYKFPTLNIEDGIRFAATATSFVIGTLQDAAQTLAKNGDNGPVRSLTSSLGQEGEQAGLYRALLGLKPSEKPFITTSIAPFAYSLLLSFVDECPFSFDQINIPHFPVLSVISGKGGQDVEAKDQELEFAADFSNVVPAPAEVGKCDNLFITYFSGQNKPDSRPVKNCKWDGKKVSVKADFPFTEFFMKGLSIASLTKKGDLAAVGDVAAATLAAPGLIQVNDPIKSWNH